MLRAFEASLIANTDILQQANSYLESIKSSSEVIQASLHIALSTHPLEIRQLSVIYLKNLTKSWKDSRREFTLPQPDKDFLKSHIIECLLFSIPDKIRSQFEEIAFNIAKAEFPWEEVLLQIQAYLASNAADQIYAALCMISQISKVYEQVLNERRNYMKTIVSKFFTQLDYLLGSLISEENSSKFRYISLILEIYWTCFYIDLPEEQASIQALQGWLYKCKAILEMPMGELEQPVVSEEESRLRDLDPKWQCKKWAAQILHRFFNKYFSTAYLKDHNKLIGEYFQGTWAVPLSELVLNLLLNISKAYVPNAVANYLLKFVAQAYKLPSTREILNKFNIQIINQVILPLLSMKHSDEELWRENPIEYIRREADLSRAYYSSKSSAVDLLVVMCEQSCLQFFLTSMVQCFQNRPDLLTKESLLFAFGSLSKAIKSDKSFVEHAEHLLFTYVLQEFGSSVGFLRSRACWVYSRFVFIQYTIPTHQDSVLTHMCKLMLDSELPVRIEAAVGLPKLLSWDLACAKITPEIQNVLAVYLELMTQIDSEDLVEALEDVVAVFAVEIVPFALDLSKRLIAAFLAMIGKEVVEQSVMAATTTLSTLGKIIDTLDDRPQDLVTISYELQPVFELILNTHGSEYFECTISLLTSLLYYCPAGALQNLFRYAGILKEYFVDNASGKLRECARDFVEELFAPVANFLQKYKEMARENIAVFLELATVLVGEGYQEIVVGCKIFVAVLENIAMDSQLLTQVLARSCKVFVSQESKKLKMLFAQIAFTAFWRAPLATVVNLKNLDIHSQIFRFIHDNAESIKEELQVMQAILGISSLLSVSAELLEYQQGFTDLVHVLIRLVEKINCKNTAEPPAGSEPEFMNMLEKLKAMEKDSTFDDCSGELYESVFEAPDLVLRVKAFLEKSRELLQVSALSAHEQQILDEFMH